MAESNATLLAQRSGALLQASQDLRPSITDAEHEYFQLLKRVRAKCEKWEDSIGELQETSRALCDAMVSGRASIDVDLTPSDVEHCRALLRGEEEALHASGEYVRQTRNIVRAVAAATGLCTGNESPSKIGASGQQ